MNREDFEILDKVAYLDNAATTQKPKIILDKVADYYKSTNANPHRGNYSLSMNATEIYDNAHEKVAKFINAKNSEEIIFTKNATESINIVAYSYALNNLKEGDEIVISIMEHHSNLVPWQEIAKKTKSKLVYLYIDENFEIPESELSKITDKTKIVAITHVSNVLGTINDIEKIIEVSHKHGAKVLVDASQSIPHMKIDVQKLDVDFLAFSGHKMLALMGIGVLYVKEEILKDMPPFIMGGDMIDYVYEDHTLYAPMNQKFEAGTQNVGGALSLSLAIDYIEKLGINNIEEYEKELLRYAREELEKLDFIETYYSSNIEKHTSVISFNIRGVHSHDVSSLLDKYNVAIRSGFHCAQPLHRRLNINSTCRISLYFYNNKEDIDKLISGLKEINKKFKSYKKDK